MLFWKSWFNKKIFFIQDILNADVNFLTFREFQNKFSIKTNLHYFQLMVAISSDLKKKARSAEVPSREQLLYSTTVSLFPESTPVDLANMRFKHYYKTLNKNSTVEPTSIKIWKINFADECTEWKNKFSFIYHSTRDNKLRQFSFKLLHRILVTKKELFKSCFFCPNPDSIEHTFLDCIVTQSFYSEALICFNYVNTTDISLSNKQITFNAIPALQQLTDYPRRRLHLFVILLKQYICACKYFEKKPVLKEFQSKVFLQWQIEICALP